MDYASGEVFIKAGTTPSGQTLTLTLKATDREDSPEAKARPDRKYTIRIRYATPRPINAGARENGRAVNAPVLRYAVAATSSPILVAAIAASGGDGNLQLADRGRLGIERPRSADSGQRPAAGVAGESIDGAGGGFRFWVGGGAGDGGLDGGLCFDCAARPRPIWRARWRRTARPPI